MPIVASREKKSRPREAPSVSAVRDALSLIADGKQNCPLRIRKAELCMQAGGIREDTLKIALSSLEGGGEVRCLKSIRARVYLIWRPDHKESLTSIEHVCTRRDLSGESAEALRVLYALGGSCDGATIRTNRSKLQSELGGMSRKELENALRELSRKHLLEILSKSGLRTLSIRLTVHAADAQPLSALDRLRAQMSGDRLSFFDYLWSMAGKSPGRTVTTTLRALCVAAGVNYQKKRHSFADHLPVYEKMGLVRREVSSEKVLVLSVADLLAKKIVLPPTITASAGRQIALEAGASWGDAGIFEILYELAAGLPNRAITVEPRKIASDYDQRNKCGHVRSRLRQRFVRLKQLNLIRFAEHEFRGWEWRIQVGPQFPAPSPLSQLEQECLSLGRVQRPLFRFLWQRQLDNGDAWFRFITADAQTETGASLNDIAQSLGCLIKAGRIQADRENRFVYRLRVPAAIETGNAPAVSYPNQERDAFCYEERLKGTTRKQIRAEIIRRGWEPISSDPGVGFVANSYQKRHDLPTIPAKKAGRPKNRK